MIASEHLDISSCKIKFDYFNQQDRRATYRKWIFKDNTICNADKMAEAGFIFVGSSRDPDSVSCFFCNKHLDGWEPTDDPWKEHLHHAKSCEFAQTQTAQENWTLEKYLELRHIYEENQIKKECVELQNKTKKYFNRLRRNINCML